MNEYLLQDAMGCPICESQPVFSHEDVLDKTLVFLRCPKNHPYVASGDDLIMAINHWNKYLSYHRLQDTHKMLGRSIQESEKTFCRSCARFTSSVVSFEKVTSPYAPGGYSVMKQECKECRLIKSQSEAA